MHRAEEYDAADARLPCRLEHIGGRYHIVRHQQVPADVRRVARLGGEMHHHILALECGRDGVEVRQVGGQRVQAVQRHAVNPAELVLVAKMVAQHLPYPAAESGYYHFLLVWHVFSSDVLV